MNDEELVTGAEIGRRFGRSRERVRQWASDPKFGFPESRGRFGAAKVWNWPEVRRWYQERYGTATELRE